MNRYHVWIPRKTPALAQAARHLAEAGVSFADSAREANVILLPVPTPPELMASAGPGQLCIGGNLPEGLDLLKDPEYLAENAAITAEAALGILLPALPCPLRGCRILLLGGGRIGVCLGQMLKALGADLTLWDRKPEKRALLRALGCDAPETLPDPKPFRAVINTIPAAVLPENTEFSPACVRLELASGQFLPGDAVISARGLPGKCKPEASGALIARLVLQYLKGGSFL